VGWGVAVSVGWGVNVDVGVAEFAESVEGAGTLELQPVNNIANKIKDIEIFFMVPSFRL
jgi:hypothetical protein